MWLKVRQWELEEGSWRPHLEAGRVHTLYPMPPILRHKGLDTSTDQEPHGYVRVSGVTVGWKGMRKFIPK